MDNRTIKSDQEKISIPSFSVMTSGYNTQRIMQKKVVFKKLINKIPLDNPSNTNFDFPDIMEYIEEPSAQHLAKSLTVSSKSNSQFTTHNNLSQINNSSFSSLYITSNDINL